MNVNRGLVFWGVALITAGAVALAIQAGAVAGGDAQQLWRFWPVALIVIGLAVIAARTPFALVATITAALVIGVLGGSLVSGFPEGLSIGCAGDPDQVVSAEGSFGTRHGSSSTSTAATSPCRWAPAPTGPSRPPTAATPSRGSRPTTARCASPPREVASFGVDRQEWDVTVPLRCRSTSRSTPTPPRARSISRAHVVGPAGRGQRRRRHHPAVGRDAASCRLT